MYTGFHMRSATLQQRLAGLFEVAQGGDRIPSMEGIRGLAVLLVFCVHFDSLFRSRLPGQSPLVQVSGAGGIIGQSGVDLFFVLSGYLIYGKLIGKRVRYPGFLLRRVQRIHPAFLCVVALYLLLHWTVLPIPRFPQGALPGIAYVLENIALLPGLFDIQPLFTVAWSLSYELFFYATIPAVIWCTGMRHWSGRARCVFFLASAAVYSVLHLEAGAWMVPRLPLAPAGHPRLLMFVAGILIFEGLSRRGPIHLPPRGEWASAIVFVLGFCAYAALSLNGWLAMHARTALCQVLVLFVCIPGFLIYCFAYPGFLQRCFQWTPLRWLGNMSYSYYLLHGLALLGLNSACRYLAPAGSSTWLWAGLLLLSIPVTLAPSALLFLAVEKPFSLRPAAGRSRVDATRMR
jgi:peptidoglycan/LPS O-acetylase OafA/YrhL